MINNTAALPLDDGLAPKNERLEAAITRPQRDAIDEVVASLREDGHSGYGLRSRVVRQLITRGYNDWLREQGAGDREAVPAGAEQA